MNIRRLLLNGEDGGVSFKQLIKWNSPNFLSKFIQAGYNIISVCWLLCTINWLVPQSIGLYTESQPTSAAVKFLPGGSAVKALD